MPDPAHTITSVQLSLVSAYTPGDASIHGAILLWNYQWQWKAHQQVDGSWNSTYPAWFYTTTGWGTRTDTLALLTYPTSPTGVAIRTGAVTRVYSDALGSDVAYDNQSLGALLQTLRVSAYAYNTVGSAVTNTSHLKVYAAYVDVTYADSHTHRYWASGWVEIPAGNAPATTHAIAAPTDVLNPERAIDQDILTYADIEETNPSGVVNSPLWAPAALVLDWGLHILCGVPPDGTIGTSYSYLFAISGGLAPYSVSVTGGELPPGLTMGADGTASGIPTRAGSYSFTLTATDAGSTDVLVATATAGGAGMTMPTLTPSLLPQAAASSAAYMGVNALNYPYWAIAVSVAPPTTPIAGVASYEVTVQTCAADGTASGAEKDFYNVSSTPDAPIKSQTLLSDYGAAPATAVKFRLYSVATAGGARTLISTAWSGASTHITDAGTTPTPGGPTMPTLPTTTHTVAEASPQAVYMGLNSLSQQYWSIAVVVAPVGTDTYEITAQTTDASGTADPAGTEQNFFAVHADPSLTPFPSQTLLGTYQASPTSTYTSITFRAYVVNPDGSRTLLPLAWNGTADHQTVPFGAAPVSGTVPAALPPMMTASVLCSITVVGGALTADCGTPGIITLGTPFTFRPTVQMGSVVLDSSYDADGTLTWLVTGLPPGLIWDYTSGSATFGSIAGVATQVGTFVYTAVITTSDGQTATITCTLQVEGSGFDAACGTPPTAAQGLPFSFAPPFAAGTTYAAWTFTGLPPGLNWDSTGGTILGVPTTLGSYVYTATMTGAAFTCSITVVAAGDSGPAACGSSGTLLVGIPFAFTPPFTSAAPVTAWAFSGLPPGLGWDTDPLSATYGMVAGIPSATGGYGYHATATAVDGTVLAFTCSLVVLLPGDPGDGANDSGGKGVCWYLDLWTWQPVFAFEHLNIQVQFPYAYERALRYALARELAGTYGRDPGLVSTLAAEAESVIDGLNVSNVAGTEDPPPQPPVAAQG
jgi:hypothetical protein